MFHFNPDHITCREVAFPHRIWKVRPDPFSDWVALELRDVEGRVAAYSVYDLSSEASPPLAIPLDWWEGIEDFRGGLVLVHGYADHAAPVHLGLRTLTPTGDVKWHFPGLRFEGMLLEGVAVSGTDALQTQLHVLDLETGEVIRVFPDRLAPEFQAALAAYDSRRVEGMAFPEMAPQGDPRFVEWTERLGVTPFGAVHLLEMGERTVVAWHEGDPEAGFALAIAIFQGEELLLDGWLEENMTGMHPDPFFKWGTRIIATSGQSKLVIIE